MAGQQQSEEAKSKWESRTVWLGVLTLAAAMLADPSVLAVIPLAWLPKITATAAIIAIVLRFLTTQPIK